MVSMDGERPERWAPTTQLSFRPEPSTASGLTGSDAAHLLVFFPALNPYSEEHTHYLEGGAASFCRRLRWDSRQPHHSRNPAIESIPSGKSYERSSS